LNHSPQPLNIILDINRGSTSTAFKYHYYLFQGDYVLDSVYLSVCVSVSKFTQKLLNESL